MSLTRLPSNSARRGIEEEQEPEHGSYNLGSSGGGDAGLADISSQKPAVANVSLS